MSDAITNELHELLCAYLFDEVTPAEAQRLEAALDALPELRAERQRLEQTIHLVHDAYEGEDKLSETAVASLLEAAGPVAPILNMRAPGARSWHQSPGLRAAAAVMVLSGSVWLALCGDLGMGDVRPNEPSSVASVPADARDIVDAL